MKIKTRKIYLTNWTKVGEKVGPSSVARWLPLRYGHAMGAQQAAAGTARRAHVAHGGLALRPVLEGTLPAQRRAGAAARLRRAAWNKKLQHFFKKLLYLSVYCLKFIYLSIYALLRENFFDISIYSIYLFKLIIRVLGE